MQFGHGENACKTKQWKLKRDRLVNLNRRAMRADPSHILAARQCACEPQGQGPTKMYDGAHHKRPTKQFSNDIENSY
jgi:hypothetical protein